MCVFFFPVEMVVFLSVLSISYLVIRKLCFFPFFSRTTVSSIFRPTT